MKEYEVIVSEVDNLRARKSSIHGGTSTSSRQKGAAS